MNTFVAISECFCSHVYHCTSSSAADKQLAKWLSTSSIVNLSKKSHIKAMLNYKIDRFFKCYNSTSIYMQIRTSP